MKIFTYLRTLWHEFWMAWWVGPAIKDYPSSQELKSVECPIPIMIPQYLEDMKEPTPVNCKVSSSQYLTKLMTSGNTQIPTLRIGPADTVLSKKKLWVYNASRVDHKFDHPMLGEVKIPANTTKKRYSMWTSFPEVVAGLNFARESNELYPHFILGDYFVKDLIYPDNIGSFRGSSTSIGRDLSVKGVFWSYNNPPLVREVNAAVRKMADRYADLLERMAILWESVQLNGEWIKAYKKLRHCSTETAIVAYRNKAVGEITPEHHVAAEYFKVTTPWHPVLRG